MSQNLQPSLYYSEWQNNRINFILEKYSPDFFMNKKVLELGPCNGYIGSYFQKKLGSEVLAVEGRKENIQEINQNYPDLNVIEGNLDSKDWIYGKHDVIVNFGLLYHLDKYHYEHLENCIKNCKILFLESVIFDAAEPGICYRQEAGFDQSMSDKGGTPTTSFVENVFKNNNCKYTKFTDSKLNGEEHHYDWPDVNSYVLDPWARRFWIVETGN